MNYLAHVFLADRTPESVLGNILADFVRGKAHLDFAPAVQAGVVLHRRVDSFTDSHPVTHRSMGRVRGRWGWFSGILIDVFYDHFLALDWERYSDVPLREFVETVHAALLAQRTVMPAEMQEMLDRMIRDERLLSYRELDGIEQTLQRISGLVRSREVHLEEAMADLRLHYDALREDFHEFFPQLAAFVAEQKKSLSLGKE